MKAICLGPGLAWGGGEGGSGPLVKGDEPECYGALSVSGPWYCRARLRSHSTRPRYSACFIKATRMYIKITLKKKTPQTTNHPHHKQNHKTTNPPPPVSGRIRIMGKLATSGCYQSLGEFELWEFLVHENTQLLGASDLWLLPVSGRIRIMGLLGASTSGCYHKQTTKHQPTPHKQTKHQSLREFELWEFLDHDNTQLLGASDLWLLPVSGRLRIMGELPTSGCYQSLGEFELREFLVHENTQLLGASDLWLLPNTQLLGAPTSGCYQSLGEFELREFLVHENTKLLGASDFWLLSVSGRIPVMGEMKTHIRSLSREGTNGLKRRPTLQKEARYRIYGPGVNITVPLGKHATVFQAEAMAIDSCSRRLIQMRTKGLKYLILSDSQAALKALDTCWFDSKACEGVDWEGGIVVKKLRAMIQNLHVGKVSNRRGTKTRVTHFATLNWIIKPRPSPSHLSPISSLSPSSPPFPPPYTHPLPLLTQSACSTINSFRTNKWFDCIKMVESIMRGEDVGITPRRSRSSTAPAPPPHTHTSTLHSAAESHATRYSSFTPI
ncbi:hypothetical protein J6590_072004 [Homalodisca vitripennis]|nr:hypothetical protein J6590_072004 [Homalodisca vitripennis]